MTQSQAGVKQRILIADDEKDVLSLIGGRLECAGYDVYKACDGAEALKKFDQVKPDLVILDVMMEEVTGYETCAVLKGKKETKDIPVILLTSRIRSIDENLGYICYADAYIRKPRSSELLLPEVRRLLKEAEDEKMDNLKGDIDG